MVDSDVDELDAVLQMEEEDDGKNVRLLVSTFAVVNASEHVEENSQMAIEIGA